MAGYSGLGGMGGKNTMVTLLASSLDKTMRARRVCTGVYVGAR